MRRENLIGEGYSEWSREITLKRRTSMEGDNLNEEKEPILRELIFIRRENLYEEKEPLLGEISLIRRKNLYGERTCMGRDNFAEKREP